MRPELLVCLGAVAAQAVFGSSFRLTESRGGLLTVSASADDLLTDLRVLATVHPSAVLRAGGVTASLCMRASGTISRSHPRLIRAAIDYAAAHSSDIDARIRRHHQMVKQSQRVAAQRETLLA